MDLNFDKRTQMLDIILRKHRATYIKIGLGYDGNQKMSTKDTTTNPPRKEEEKPSVKCYRFS